MTDMNAIIHSRDHLWQATISFHYINTKLNYITNTRPSWLLGLLNWQESSKKELFHIKQVCFELTTLFVQPFQSGRPTEARRKRWSLKRCTGTSCFRCNFCFSVSQGGEKKGTRGEFKMEYNIAPALCSSFDKPSHISLAVDQTTLIYHLNKRII